MEMEITKNPILTILILIGISLFVVWIIIRFDKKADKNPLSDQIEGFENDDLFKIFKVLNHMRWMMFGFIFIVIIQPWLLSQCSN